jgi:hypothetical protein
LQILYRNEVDGSGVRAMDAEEVHLALVVTSGFAGLKVMPIAAAYGEADGAATESSCLTLNASKMIAIVDDKVITGVLAERQEDREAGSTESEHDRERRPVADVLRVLHILSLHQGSAGPCPEQTTRSWPTIEGCRSSSVGRATHL